MFFLTSIIFLIQLTVLVILVTWLINLDLRILRLTKEVNIENKWLSGRFGDIEGIFTGIRDIIKQRRDKWEKRRRMMIIADIIGILEWLLLIVAKPCGKKFILGYKLTKAIVKELSVYRNMV